MAEEDTAAIIGYSSTNGGVVDKLFVRGVISGKSREFWVTVPTSAAEQPMHADRQLLGKRISYTASFVGFAQ